MDIINFSAPEYKMFILILIRVSIILFMFPVFSSPVMPMMAKTGLALTITLLVYPSINMDPSLYPTDGVGFGLLVLGEFIVGMVLGYTVDIFFGAVQMAGQIVGFQMGFSMINVIDPQSGANLSMMSQIAYLVAVLIFILLGGHHMLLKAMIDSFTVIPMGGLSLKPGMLEQLRALVNGMFVLGIKMAAPAMGALVFTNAAFGICAKFVPQMNVLIVAFPIQITVGLVMFGFTLQIVSIMAHNFIGSFYTLLSSLMAWMGG